MFPKLTPITKAILFINIGVYIVTNFVYPQFYNFLAAFYPFSPNFNSWQILTHMFMHAPMGQGIGLTHILFNMLTLWSFGPVLEQTMGDRKFLVLYFVSGLGAFFLFNVWNFYEVHQLTQSLTNQGINVAEIFHKSALSYSGNISVNAKSPQAAAEAQALLNTLQTPMLGASGAIFGLIAAFSTLFPDSKLYLMFIPFGIKAKYLLPGIIVISLYFGFSGSMDGIAHFAHIGGAIAGYFIAKHFANNRYRIN